MKVYISGPMRGYKNFNFPAFDAARDFLIELGYEPISPADHDRSMYPNIEEWAGYADGDTDLCPDFDYLAAISWDLRAVMDADAIALLPGWEHSSGATHERYVAEVTGKRVFYIDPEHGRFEPESSPIIIGISGRKRAGKDTIGECLVRRAGFKRIAFADGLRRYLYALNPYVMHDENYFESLSDFVDRVGWERAKDECGDVRRLLQRIGTEAGRAILGDNVWIDLALRDVKPGGLYVVTDVRYPNEADAIRERGGEIWRVERPGVDSSDQHPSETAMDGYDFDRVFVNCGTVDDLRRKALDSWRESRRYGMV